MNYILEFSSPEIKRCMDCRFYVDGSYYDDSGWEYDRYCTAEESPLTDDPDLRMDWCPLRKKEEARTLPPKSNADRIRKMKDEELADVIQGQCACCAYQLTGCTEKECKDGAYEWLIKEEEG